MLQKVRKKMEELNMVMPQDTILVGVSGGADSVCLLLLLSTLSKQMGFHLEALHVEHGIRGQESQEDADFVMALCRELGVPCQVKHVDVPAYSKETGLGIEETARFLRYKEFARLAMEKNAKVALAHHMEDNAETMLFQMVRGSALAGLCGMKPIRTDDNGVTYIRPLLFFRRSEIENYLNGCGQEYRVDSTNYEVEYSRNYLRQRILPQLNEVNMQAVQHLNETAEHLREIRDYLDIEVEHYWSELVEKDKTQLWIDLPRLANVHIVIQKEIIYRAISQMEGGKKDISSVHVESVLDLCKNQSGKEVSLPNGVVARKEFHRLVFLRKRVDTCTRAEEVTPFVEISKAQLNNMLETGKTIEIPLKKDDEKILLRIFSYQRENAEIPKKPYTKWFDYDKIKDGFCIRNRLSGDYFIGDDAGHRKKLKQYFIDEKISPTERAQMWLLAQEKLVLWAIGGRISEHLKVTKETTTVLEIVYKGGN